MNTWREITLHPDVNLEVYESKSIYVPYIMHNFSYWYASLWKIPSNFDLIPKSLKFYKQFIVPHSINKHTTLCAYGNYDNEMNGYVQLFVIKYAWTESCSF